MPKRAISGSSGTADAGDERQHDADGGEDERAGHPSLVAIPAAAGRDDDETHKINGVAHGCTIALAPSGIPTGAGPPPVPQHSEHPPSSTGRRSRPRRTTAAGTTAAGAPSDGPSRDRQAQRPSTLAAQLLITSPTGHPGPTATGNSRRALVSGAALADVGSRGVPAMAQIRQALRRVTAADQLASGLVSGAVGARGVGSRRAYRPWLRFRQALPGHCGGPTRFGASSAAPSTLAPSQPAAYRPCSDSGRRSPRHGDRQLASRARRGDVGARGVGSRRCTGHGSDSGRHSPRYGNRSSRVQGSCAVPSALAVRSRWRPAMLRSWRRGGDLQGFGSPLGGCEVRRGAASRLAGGWIALGSARG
jgi:hypothetical protein